MCGYYVYNEMLEVAVAENLVCVKELSNAYDKDAVSVEKNSTTIGHLPQKA